ncbi:phage tail protein [Stutzerimonas nitrititolerans]|uniref:phage tail protein n=1 Tax=Stutzerimonas nitrititolerans TaxID=2482751 RepID=UPI0028A9E408|nr:phage tail protein [Stutzerimonas nitrititolerans]
MVDVNTQFGGFLTDLGAAKNANANALGIPWKLTHMLIGDANGGDPVPAPGQTALVNQVYRAQLNQLYVSPTDANVLIAELVLPPNVGGWWIRELALEDEDGVFSAVAKCPPSYKPLLAQGSGRNQVVRMHVVTSGTANIQLKIDPSVVLATRAYCDGLVASHAAAANPHPQYATEAEVAALIAAIPASTDGLAGNASALRAEASGTNAIVSVSADAVCLKDSAGRQKVLGPVALTINSAAVGTNGLDTGLLLASTWYSVWVIWNGTTAAGLLSLSATAPTLPAGYKHKARLGWIRTDATTNRYPLGFVQAGRRVQFRIAAGSNISRLPVMVAGAQGNVFQPPAFVPVAVGAFVPPTACAIKLTLFGNFSNSSAFAAPNASHYGATVNAESASPLHLSQGATAGQTHMATTGELILESGNIYYASSTAASGMACAGWEDNL